MWTVQELALGNDGVIVCGNEELAIAVLERFSEGFQINSIGYWKRALHLWSNTKSPQPPIKTHVEVLWTSKGFSVLDVLSQNIKWP